MVASKKIVLDPHNLVERLQEGDFGFHVEPRMAQELLRHKSLDEPQASTQQDVVNEYSLLFTLANMQQAII